MNPKLRAFLKKSGLLLGLIALLGFALEGAILYDKRGEATAKAKKATSHKKTRSRCLVLRRPAILKSHGAVISDRLVADKTVVYGIDVSHFQGQVNWDRVKKYGVAYGYAKATDGTHYVDPCFKRNWEGMKEAGMVRGAYHFFRPNQSGIAQAKAFLSALGTDHVISDLPPVLDLEFVRGVSVVRADYYVKQALAFLTYVEAKLGVKPIVYTNAPFYQVYLKNNQKIADYTLWLAHYTRKVPGPVRKWGPWKIWQFTEKGLVQGVNSRVDMNAYSGTPAQFIKFADERPSLPILRAGYR